MSSIPTAPGADAAQRRGILVTVCIALMAVIAAVTGLNVAQPQLALELGATQGQVLWIINIYTITLAALLLPLGVLGDRWGRRPVLLLGLAVFGLANVLSALAPSATLMLVARLLSGVGAAFIMPVTLSVITSVFADEERSRAIGVWTAVAGGGGLLGMFLSALLVDVLSWRWLFVLPVVLVAVAAVLALRRIPDVREPALHRFDGVGSLLSLLAVLGLIVFLHEGPQRGWASWPVLASLVLGVAASLGFIGWERRQAAPLLDVRLFGHRGLSSGSVALLVWFGVQSGVFIVPFPFFQAVLGWSGLRATLALMPMALLMMGFSGVAPRLAGRIGARLTLAAGIALGAVGLAPMALQVSVAGGYLSVLPGMLAMGTGMGLAMAPATEAITTALPADRQGVASALNDVTREFGTALGIALLGAVFSAGYAHAIAQQLADLPAPVVASAGRGIADALALAAGGQPYAAAVYRAAQQAFVQGWQQAMWAGAAVMLALLLFVLRRSAM
ncbi:MAG: Antiseptic resistance protein [Stenotrophomonas maltophilia]|uniref:Antiseptic resistance protein n=1 Tax=Stenotrophomonas maltophilia TaxID=40324 RepID=A0A7V8JN71_STEMA|nr:MAG: Antiseptic resistance protein [Stenotrophomonas maltophilia]